METRRLPWIAFAAAALPAVVPFCLILLWGVDCPQWDQWDDNFAGLYIRAADGQLSFWDFTAQHNEHRAFVPRTLMFALNSLTKWNTRAEMLMTWVAVCLTSIAVLWLIRQTIGEGRIDGSGLFLWFLCNLMIFTLSQQENWLWGIGLMNVLPAAGIVWSMAVLHMNLNRWVQVVLAMLFCAGSMFSSGNGLLAFPLVGLMLAWSESKEQLKDKRNVLIAWLAGFLLCVGMFAWGYQLPPAPTASIEKVTNLGQRAQYFFAFLGNHFYSIFDLSWRKGSFLAGTILMTMILAASGYLLLLWRRGQVRVISRALPWCVLAMFSILSALMASIFRASIGIENALSSRYVVVTLYLCVALIVLVPLLCRDLLTRYPHGRLPGLSWPLTPIWSGAPLMLTTFLLIAYLGTISRSLTDATVTHYARTKIKSALLLMNVLPNTPKLANGVYPKVDELRVRANRLNELGYLRPGLITSTDPTSLSDESANVPDPARWGQIERLVETGPNIVTAVGWALCPRRNGPVDAVVLTYLNEQNQQQIFAMSEMLDPRPDLTRRFNDSSYDLSGWSIAFEIGFLPKETKSVPIKAWTLDNQTGRFRPLFGTMHIVAAAQTR